MKWYRTPDGEQRLWFDPDELELMMEDELRKAGLYPTLDSPVTDLERFIEGHLHASLDQYSDLESSVLGVTEFAPGAAPRIAINRDLTGSALDGEDGLGTLGRWRATLAHEATHTMVHRALFELDSDELRLFPHPSPAGQSANLMRCLKRDVGYSVARADWREVQANRGMAALLMPPTLFKRIVRSELNDLGRAASELCADAPLTPAVALRLAEKLDVSRQAVLIRLETLGFTSPAGSRAFPLPPT